MYNRHKMYVSAKAGAAGGAGAASDIAGTATRGGGRGDWGFCGGQEGTGSVGDSTAPGEPAAFPPRIGGRGRAARPGAAGSGRGWARPGAAV